MVSYNHSKRNKTTPENYMIVQEEINMKNSVTKKIAAVLAAVITISTMASVGTTAFAAEVTGTAAVTAAAENISVREEAEDMGRKYLDALPACNLKGTVYSASWSKMGCFMNVGECEQANADGKAIVEYRYLIVLNDYIERYGKCHTDCVYNILTDGTVVYYKYLHGSYSTPLERTVMSWDRFVKEIESLFANAVTSRNNDIEIEKGRKEMDSLSLEQVLDEWANLEAKPVPAAYQSVDAEEEENTKTELDPVVVALENYGKKLVKLSAEKAVEACPSPINSMFKAPVGSLVDMALGNKKSETSNADVIEAVNKQAKEIKDKIDNLEKTLIQDNADSNSSASFGKDLDAFTAAAKSVQNDIDIVLGNKSLTTDNQRAVHIANIIGRADRIGSSVIYSAMCNANLVLVGKPDTDKTNRNLFELAYDMNKSGSLFTGEVIDKSQNYVIKRVNTYIRNDLVLLEVLKAHQRISEFTPEEVKALDAGSRKIYDEIVGSSYKSKRYIATIISQLMKSDEANEAAKKNNEEGLINKTRDFFAQDRLVYINEGTENIAMKKDLRCFKDEELTYTYDGKERSRTNVMLDSQKIDALLNAQKLSEKKVEMLVKHAADCGMTLRGYLEAVGFNVSNIPETDVENNCRVYLGTSWFNHNGQAGSWGVSWSGSWGVKGVYLDIKETGLHNNDLVYEKVRAMETWQHKLSDNCRDYTVFFEAK